MVRRYAILVNAVAVKAIVFFDKCYLLVPDGADEILSVFQEGLQHAGFDELEDDESDSDSVSSQHDFGGKNKKYMFKEKEDMSMRDRNHSSHDMKRKCPQITLVTLIPLIMP